MPTKNLYLDIHVLQTIPPSCINRDDTGTPKTCYVGGTQRARVSSQAWKHSMHNYFNEHMESEDVGIHTRKLVELIKGKILELRTDLTSEEAEDAANAVLSDAHINDPKTLFFISPKQAEALAQIAVEDISEAGVKLSAKEKKEKQRRREVSITNALNANPTIDQALFGRMAASNGSIEYEASAQVAHAFSTHAVDNEVDYFTAVDDLQSNDETGAAHVNTTEFNSSTLYRYANVNLHQLYRYLGSRTAQAAEDFAEAFINAMPTGKIHSYANRTYPGMIYATLRNETPVNMAPAFEKAIGASKEGYEMNSKEAFASYAEWLYDNFVKQPDEAFIVGMDMDGAKRVTAWDLLRQIKNVVEKEVVSGEE